MRKKLSDALILLLAAVFLSTKGPATLQQQAADVTVELAELPAAIGEAVAGLASTPVATGRHLGFDTYAYPGDAAMQAWRHQDVPYEWVGYYLPAPCHKGSTWSGKRERLTDMGWGMAVIYVGQQAWEQMGPPPAAPKAKPSSRARSKALRGARTARGTRKATARKATARKASTAKAAKARKATARKASVRKTSVRKTSTKRVRGGALRPAAVTSTGPSTCARPLLSAARGRMEADDAVAKTAAEGFAPGSVIFLDIERMERVPEAMREYYRAWTARVLEDGRYRPGYYAHKHNAERIYADVKAEYRAAGRKGEPPFWIASGRGFSPDKAPHEVGHAFAAVWQGVLDKFETRNGVRLPIDVNVAAVPSPSSHLYASAE